VTVNANSGNNENNIITGNTINNVYVGIHLRGSSSSLDQGAIVGMSGSGNGNLIQNFGGSSSTQPSYGILLDNQNNPAISFNSIDNAGGGGSSAHEDDMYGISVTGSTGNLNLSDNTITLSVTSANFFSVYWIYVGTNASSVSISNNVFSVRWRIQVRII
jgi:hypothetical protein